MTASTALAVRPPVAWHDLPDLATIPALTTRQPWVAAIVRRLKPVENRSWAPYGPAAQHGWMWLHEAGRDAGKFGRRFVTELGHHELAAVPCQPGIVAAVRFGTTVCALPPGDSPDAGPGCQCGPWAFPGECHWPILDVRPLPGRVPCAGALKLWSPTTVTLDAIRALIAPATGRTAA